MCSACSGRAGNDGRITDGGGSPAASSRSRPILFSSPWVFLDLIATACWKKPRSSWTIAANIAASTDDYLTSKLGVFACGDMRRGQSLVVWAIREGRQCARAVDEALMGTSDLPR